MLQVKNIVKKFVFFVPERDAFAGDIVHGFRNVQEMLKEFQSDIFIGGIVTSQFQRNGEHIEAEHPHPTCAVTLFNVTSGWERSAAVEHADVIQAQKAALKYIQTFGVFAVDPPREVQHQFVEYTLQETAVAGAVLLFVDFINAPRCPRQHWRVDISKCPLISRDLSVRMLIPLASK